MTALMTRLTAAADFARANPSPAIHTREHYLPGSHPPLLSTGYYGRFEGRRIRVTKVHVRLAGERGPLCGSVLHPDMAWHWCASRAADEYIECERCQTAVDAIREQAAARTAERRTSRKRRRTS